MLPCRNIDTSTDSQIDLSGKPAGLSSEPIPQASSRPTVVGRPELVERQRAVVDDLAGDGGVLDVELDVVDACSPKGVGCQRK